MSSWIAEAAALL